MDAPRLFVRPEATPEICARCGHLRRHHCKGGVFHSNYKDAMRRVPHPRGDHCRSAHCEEPLCSCTNYTSE